MGKPAKAEIDSALSGEGNISIPPPPYTPNDAVTASQSSTAQLGLSLAPGNAKVPVGPHVSLYHPIPRALSVYPQMKFTRTAHLGNSTNHKLYAISSYIISAGGKYDGKPCLILHNGPSNKDTALATVGEEPNWTLASTASVITLPPLNYVVGAAATAEGQASIGVTEIMRSGIFDHQVTFWFRFSIEVDQGGMLHREDFEWQKANENEMDGAKAVFKLVRLNSGTPRNSGTDNDLQDAGLVAIVGFKGTLSWNKPFRFEFVGEGATGDMGDRWAIMALTTALRIWFLHIQGRVR